MRVCRVIRHPLCFFVTLAVILRTGTGNAAPPCPENHIVLTVATGISVSATSVDSVLDVSGPFGHGSYDLTTNLLTSNVSFYDPGSLESRWAGSFVDTEDDYWITGVAAGTPVDFSAEFTVTGSWHVFPGVPQGEYSSEAFVSVEADTARYSIPLPGGCCHGGFGQVLTLPLHRFAQQPFRLRLHLASQDYRGGVDESGRLQFTGLPFGATVVNCHTASEPVTPTRWSTWGQVKAHYR